MGHRSLAAAYCRVNLYRGWQLTNFRYGVLHTGFAIVAQYILREQVTGILATSLLENAFYKSLWIVLRKTVFALRTYAECVCV